MSGNSQLDSRRKLSGSYPVSSVLTGLVSALLGKLPTISVP